MTKEKALFILGEMPEWNSDYRYSRDEYEEIIELCRALLVVSDNENGSDLISREAVIDLLNQYGYYNKEMKRDLSAIPSAVPESETLEKIRAEIEALIYYVGEPPYSLIEVVNVDTVLEIIDKYIKGKAK